MFGNLKIAAQIVALSAFLGASFAHAQSLSMGEMTESQFERVVRGAQRSGETIYLPPTPMEDLVGLVSLQGSGIGDFVYLSGMDPNAENDNLITNGDLKDLYETFKRVSRLGFRISMKMTARTYDLKEALQTTVPTIIVWTSHGNEEGIYDGDYRLPSEIFKNASPSVYQFILTSCNGGQARDSVYKNSIPASMKMWAWSRLVYHPTDLGNFVNDPAQWNPFENYPGEPKIKGLVCKKDAGNKFALFKGETRIGFPIWATKELCLQRAAQSNQGFVCAPTNDKGELGLFSLITNEPIEGTRYNNESKDMCFFTPSRAFNGKICRGVPKAGSKETVHRVVPAQTGKVEMGQDFKDYESCVNSIMNSQDI